MTIETKCVTTSGEWDYEGDVDEYGQACGYGTAVSKENGNVYKGTWLDNLPHGIGYLNTRQVGE